MVDRRLTLKQQRFIDAFVGRAMGNATEAAAAAGYDGDRGTLAAIAAENLRKPHIAAAISARTREQIMEHDEAAHRLSMMARANLLHFMRRDEESGTWVVDIAQAAEKGLGPAIREVTIENGTIRLKLVDSLKALVEIVRMHERARAVEEYRERNADRDLDATLKRFGLLQPAFTRDMKPERAPKGRTV